MPKPYPDPTFNTTTSFISHVNVITNNWATILVCVAVLIVAFALMKRQDYKNSQCLLVGTFGAFFFSTFFWAAKLLAGRITVLFLFLAILAGLYSVFDRD